MSILAIIIGAISYFTLPVENYPQVAPPTIEVSATFPGADAKTVSDTVATPLEQSINGVENMIYMTSQSTNDGNMRLSITFELGTDLDIAQVQVQNRVQAVEPRLPEPVRRLGVTTEKNSPDLMMVVHLVSPEGVYDQTYIGNYAVLYIKDQIDRIQGVGSSFIFGASEYAMRIWLNPDRIAELDMSPNEVLNALREQNVQVASGTLNQSPVPAQNAYELSVQTQGRLDDASQFENIIVKSDGGRIVRVKDVGRVELGAQNYITRGFLSGKPAVAIPIFQRPGSNALETADQIIALMDNLSKDFPRGLQHEIVYNPTEFVAQSIDAVYRTIFEAAMLVVIVILVFLQTWRAAVIPIVAIPVSLIGTFAVMSALGFSLNTLTLFGLVLAIGIVVDDAIVVVENMSRNLQKGMERKEAARKAMNEVGSALVATSLVLIAVFLPTTFLEGISGKFYQQFGTIVAVATVISTFVSLTLSPAIGALLLKRDESNSRAAKKSLLKAPLRSFFSIFNRFLESLTSAYGWLTGKMIRLITLCLIIYAGLMAFTAWQFQQAPGGFIPQADQGYFIVALQLPPGSSLDRTEDVVLEASSIIGEIPGVDNAVGFAGFSGATFTNASNAAVIFTPLKSFEYRIANNISYEQILGQLRGKMAQIQEAFVVVIPPPPVRGVGRGGGFKMMVQDRAGNGLNALQQAAQKLAGAANQDPRLTSVFSFFEVSTPKIYLDIDRTRAEKLGVPISNIFDALQIYIGSVFVNDFNYLGRTFRVTAQADAPYRLTPDDVTRIRVMNKDGGLVPLGSVARPVNQSGSSRVPRYNLFPAAAVQGDTAQGVSSGEALTAMETLADEVLPDGFGYEWTEIALEQKKVGNTASIAFILAVTFVFLLLAAQYESWILPLAIILIVPMCLLSAISGINLDGLYFGGTGENNIMSQIGFVVLIGLACKNAILIVEFANQMEKEGKDIYEAAVMGAKMRFRPILMTSFAFILGVVPLVTAEGAGAELRQALGITVFSGMIGVTVFGLLFTPVFYVLCRKLGNGLSKLFSGGQSSEEAKA